MFILNSSWGKTSPPFGWDTCAFFFSFFGGGEKCASVLWLGIRLLQALHEICVCGWVDEARVRVPLHQRVDLLLGLLERVWGWLQHLPVNHVSNLRIQTDLEDVRGGASHIGGLLRCIAKAAKVRQKWVLLSSSKPHLFRREDGDEVLVYLTDLLLNHSLVGLLLQILAGKPEHHVLLAELGPQEMPEAATTRCALHHPFERWRPGAGVLKCGPQTRRRRSHKPGLLNSSGTSQIDSASCWDPCLPFFTVHGSLWSLFTSGPLDSLVLAPNSQTEGENAPDASTVHFVIHRNAATVSPTSVLLTHSNTGTVHGDTWNSVLKSNNRSSCIWWCWSCRLFVPSVDNTQSR